MLRVVELARSLASRPRVLLLDEPASGLSAEEREELRSLIRRIRDQGVAVVLVEHDVPLVMELADRIMVLHHGRLLAEGAPSAISTDEEVVAAYLGQSNATVPVNRHRATGDRASTLLRVSRLSAGYGAVDVLHEVDVDVRSGEIVAVLGANGAGKTTLLRAVMGIVPSHGAREFDGASIAGLVPERVTRRGLALVPEGRELFRGLTVHDHMLLGAFGRRGRSDGADLDADLAEVYDLFPALEERRSQPADTLSGGQQQMVAIARALMSRPKLLLLDEPLLGLAPLVVEDILRAIVALADRGCAVVVVEQNAAVVLPIVDRAYVLRQGRVAVTGVAVDLMSDPSVRAAFLGDAATIAGGSASSSGPGHAGERMSSDERGVHS
jgi:ABC-type branched-subunit amino acid transport system ATPase component